jgi:hypothetical protein
LTSLPLSLPRTTRASAVVGWVGLLVLLAVAIPTRVLNLEAFAGKFDEGIRGTQLMLMAAGYRPFREIFASQGPLSLDVFFPTYMLFGQTLGAARLAPALFSIVGVVVAAWAARYAGGRTTAGLVAGAVTGLLLALSPIFLKNSRLALVEVPALVPAIGAVGAALAYGRSGDRRWLVGAGVLMALALAIKPLAAPALVPIGLAILVRGRGWLHGGLLFAAVLLAVLAVIVLAVGPSGVYDQMIRFRMASRQVEGWSLKENWAAISGEIADETLVIPVATVVAGLVLLASRWRLGLPLVGWAAASLSLLMVYSPLQFKHAVVLLPPMALLIGVAAGEGWRRWEQRHQGARHRRAAWLLAAVGAVLVAWYLVSLPRIIDLDRRLVAGMPETRPETFDDEIGLLSALTQPGDFVIVDEPSVAVSSGRLVPPNLVDTSLVRIRSRSLDADDVIAAARQYDVRALFLFSDSLRNLKPFAEWVDREFVAVKINERRNGKDRAVYLRNDADLASARMLLTRQMTQTSGATFGGQLRLLGYTVDTGDARPGGGPTVTLGWEAVGPVAADYSVVTVLNDRNGQPVEQNQRGLGGGGEGTASWGTGRWVFRTATLALKNTVQPGDYSLSIGLYDSKAKKLVPLDGAGTEPEHLSLGPIQVQPPAGQQVRP